MDKIYDFLAIVFDYTFWFVPFLFVWTILSGVQKAKNDVDYTINWIIGGACLLLMISPMLSISMHI